MAKAETARHVSALEERRERARPSEGDSPTAVKRAKCAEMIPPRPPSTQAPAGILRRPTSSPVLFWKTAHANAWLSNWSPHPVREDGTVFTTVEHYFMHRKALAQFGITW